jgi:hypothetical protein
MKVGKVSRHSAKEAKVPSDPLKITSGVVAG